MLFIYFHSRCNLVMDEIEDRLNEILGTSGMVTGGGIGETGSNIDIEITHSNRSEVITKVRTLLVQLHVPSDTTLVFDGKESGVYDN